MKIRAAVLTVMTVLLIGFSTLAYAQLTFINDPFMPVVKVNLGIKDGEAFVKLQNGFHEAVWIKEMILVSNGQRIPLLEKAEELAPAVTSTHLPVTCSPKQGSPRMATIQHRIAVRRQFPLMLNLVIVYQAGDSR